MGFLSKLMKNPLVQMALPMALTAVAGPAAGMFGKLPLFSNMSPLMANALKQTALGYGTAALSGSRRPAKAALAAGLTSIPFSYLSAANAARGFNAANAATTQDALTMQPGAGIKNIPFDPVDVEQGFFMPSQAPTMGLAPASVPYTAPKLTAMDIMLGRTPENFVGPSTFSDESYGSMRPDDAQKGFTRVFTPGAPEGDYTYTKIAEGKPLTMPTADIFTKPMKDKAGNIMPGQFTADFLPTAVSQAAGLYAGRDTPEEEFEAAKRRRRKELAFLYGVDESLISGEMDNPFYQGAFMNTGGIASLDMDKGGDVSGPGGPKDDMIDAKLSDGEFVMTAKAVENFGNGSRMEGAKRMYKMMNKLDPESEKMGER